MRAAPPQVLEAHLVAESELPEGVGMGYVQGMADVAAFMLQRMPPSRAYRCVRRLCARPIVRTFFRLDVDEWLLLSTVFSNLIGVHCPQARSRRAHPKPLPRPRQPTSECCALSLHSRPSSSPAGVLAPH